MTQDTKTRAIELLNLVSAFIDQNGLQACGLTYDEQDINGFDFALECITVAEALEEAQANAQYDRDVIINAKVIAGQDEREACARVADFRALYQPECEHVGSMDMETGVRECSLENCLCDVRSEEAAEVAAAIRARVA